MPSLAKALQKSSGKLFPFGWIPVLRAMKGIGTEGIELLLIGIRPDYQNLGLNALLIGDLFEKFKEKRFKWAETNAVLEDNYENITLWRDFAKESGEAAAASVNEDADVKDLLGMFDKYHLTGASVDNIVKAIEGMECKDEEILLNKANIVMKENSLLFMNTKFTYSDFASYATKVFPELEDKDENEIKENEICNVINNINRLNSDNNITISRTLSIVGATTDTYLSGGSGDNHYMGFYIDNGGNLTLTINMQNFNNNNGGAIYNEGGTIERRTSNFINNKANDSGGAIYNFGTINNITGDFISNYII